MTTFFFDYDDTIFPSTSVPITYTKGENIEIDTQLQLLEQTVINLLTDALLYAKVFIITNAEDGWVQLSAGKYMPRLLPLLDMITVVSARTVHESTFPENPLLWKLTAFTDQLQKCSEGERKHIISIGDSHVEREAARSFKNEQTCIKTVKLVEKPSCSQLRRQLNLLKSCMEYLCTHKGDLDLMLAITAK